MVLKEVYKDLFKIGTAVESIHDRFENNEIGNPDKEALIMREFSSMTCANEMKPAYNMGWRSPEAREDYLPYVINPNAKRMLDWAKEHGKPQDFYFWCLDERIQPINVEVLKQENTYGD